MTDLLLLDATALSEAIRTKHVFCVELMQAMLAQIARLNPQVNAIIDLRDGDEVLAGSPEEFQPVRCSTTGGAFGSFQPLIRMLSFGQLALPARISASNSL